MKATGFIFLIVFAVISFNANSQTVTGQTSASREEVVDWLNKKFSLYKIQPADIPKNMIETIKFDDCAAHFNGAFEVPDGIYENVTINLLEIKNIEYFDMHGGTLYINYGENIVYIGFDISKEPDLLNQIKKSIDYLKGFCATAN